MAILPVIENISIVWVFLYVLYGTVKARDEVLWVDIAYYGCKENI